MKPRTLLAMGLCAAIALISLGATRAFADEEKSETPMKIPDTVEGIFKAIHEQHMELAETVKNKKLEEVHHHAFAIRDLANALPAMAAADKKKQVEGTVKNISKLADDLDKAGDGGNQAETEALLKKLDGMIKVLGVQFGNA